jgi:hypothetical protein
MISASMPRDPSWMVPGFTGKLCDHMAQKLQYNNGTLRLPEDLMFFKATSGTYFQMNMNESIDIMPWQPRYNTPQKKLPIIVQ